MRILLVEARPVKQRVTVRMLGQLGYAVDVVSDGRQALDILHRGAYTVVLMDCQVPEMDGYAATREVRRRELAFEDRILQVIAKAPHQLKHLP